MSVLFIPVLSAMTLGYAWLVRYHDAPLWMQGRVHWIGGLAGLVCSAIATAPLVVWAMAERHRPAGAEEAVGALCGIVVATGTLDSWLGLGRGLDVTSAVGPLAIIALGNCRPGERRIASAMLLMLSCVAASWGSAAFAARFLDGYA
ncbi:MAG TPA: hypothetical protein VGG69_03810 [Rhizomicrobium sp.]